MQKQKEILSVDEIDALRKGDTAIFQKLFFAYQPRIYRFLWLKTHSVELAEDLVQEALLRLWQARSRIDPKGNLEIYLFRIAANLAIDALRSANPADEANLEEWAQLKDPHEADEAVLHTSLTEEISRIISSMPARVKTAFILSRFEELSHREIAEVMSISVKTVEKHIGSALKTLRKALQKK